MEILGPAISGLFSKSGRSQRRERYVLTPPPIFPPPLPLSEIESESCLVDISAPNKNIFSVTPTPSKPRCAQPHLPSSETLPPLYLQIKYPPPFPPPFPHPQNREKIKDIRNVRQACLTKTLHFHFMNNITRSDLENRLFRVCTKFRKLVFAWCVKKPSPGMLFFRASYREDTGIDKINQESPRQTK